jgi:glycosyltransferase involved in cell wall biosynthesis
MKTILVLSFSDLATDPRVNRQIRLLSKNYQVLAAGLAPPGVEGVEFIPIVKKINMIALALPSLKLLTRRFESWYWGQGHVIDCLKKLSHLRVDLVLANDIEALPVALRVAQGAKVILDAHEYSPRHFEDVFLWRVFLQEYNRYLCRTYIPRVDAMITVCEGLADAYEKEVGVKPTVITSAPDFEEIQPRLLDETTRPVRMIHHGAAGSSRKIENMIKMMDDLGGRFELNLMLTQPNPRYFQYLKRLAHGKSNIHFLPPVPMRTLPRYLNQFDIGVSLIAPTNFNYLHILPNKFFECIQARLAIAVGPSPEMARIVKEHGLGVVAEDFSPEALARNLLSLDWQKINYYKLQSHLAARILSAEENKKILLNLVHQVLEE